MNADTKIIEADAILKKLPCELYIPMYAELAEILMAREGVTIEYLPPDQYGQELRTDASEDTYIDYINQAEEILAELGVFQEEH
mgnify:FL=1